MGYRVVILSGLSGAGKSVALRALEDVGYFCIDNLPAVLIKPLIENLRGRDNLNHLAVGLDIREKEFLPEASDLLGSLRREVDLQIIFLEATEGSLLRRYRETRRPHPMTAVGTAKTLQEAIVLERHMLRQIRDDADRIIDTSNYNPHELRNIIQSMFSPSTEANGLKVSLMSFGFKYGPPHSADLLFDARFLPNPYFNPSLKPLKGTDEEVFNFVINHSETQRFLGLILELLCFLIPCYIKEGRSYLTIAIGCTGGRHRSPALIKYLSRELEERLQIRPISINRDIDNE